jgi:transcriptional regulator with XRE-family HTH domain
MLRIKELRNEMGLTQKELGEKIKSTSKNIWAYENELAVPPLDVLIRLADFFNCSLDYLSSRSDDFGNINIPSDAGEQLTQEEKAMLSNYRKLNKTNRMHADAYILVRLENQQEGTPHRA